QKALLAGPDERPGLGVMAAGRTRGQINELTKGRFGRHAAPLGIPARADSSLCHALAPMLLEPPSVSPSILALLASVHPCCRCTERHEISDLHPPLWGP